ncbi:MAG: tetratricopeptide repeat protein [Paracoccaceae bacterium]
MLRPARWLAIGLLAVGLAACDSAEERAGGHLESAMALLEQGDRDKANVEFRNVIQLQPENVEARYQIARYQRDRNQIRGAVGQYRSVLELDSNHLRARRDLAEIMLVANAVEEASRHIEVAYGIAPEDVDVRAVKAAIDFRLAGARETSPDEAVALAQGVIDDDPTNESARLVLAAHAMEQGDLKQALVHVDQGLVEDPEDLSLNVVKLGVLEQLEDAEGVGAQLQRLVDVFPETDQFREALARWHVRRGEHDAAEAQYRALAEADPDDQRRALDVVRFLNAVHGEARAREELERLAEAEDELVEYDLTLVSLDLQDGDEAAAIARLDSLIESRGRSAGAHRARVERAKLHVRNDEFEAADALISEVLANDGKNADALLLRAARHLAEDRPEAAIEDLRVAQDVDPENVRIAQLMATAYERNGNARLAQERLAEAVELSDYEVGITLRYAQLLLSDDKVGVAESVLREAIAANGPSRDLLVALGQIRIRQERWRDVEEVTARLRELDPDDPVVTRMQAAALLGRRRGEEGTELLATLAGNDPENAANLVSYVRALIAGGDGDRAREVVDERVAEAPDDTSARLLRASIRASLGDLDGAEADLLHALELEPTNAAAYAALARIYNSQGRGDEADAALEGGLALGADDPNLRLTKAMQLETSGRREEALELYSGLYREQPNSMVIANNYAGLLAALRSEDPVQIQRAYNIAKRFRTATRPQMQDTYGWLLHLTGDSKSALPILETAARQLSTNPEVQYHYGVVLLANGQLAQARDLLERALELGEQVPFRDADRAEAALARIEDIRAGRDAAVPADEEAATTQ